MATASIQSKESYLYVVVSYKDTKNKWKQKWFNTGILDIKGNKKKAEIEKYKILQDFEDSSAESNKNVGFSLYLESWLETIKKNIQKNTYASYAINIRKTVEYFKNNFGDKFLLESVETIHIQEFYNYLSEVKGLSNNSLSCKLN